MAWSSGEVIAWRLHARIDPAVPRGELMTVSPVRVVRDDPAEVAVYLAPGSVGTKRNVDKGGPHGRVILAAHDGFTESTWHRWRRVFVRDPASEHCISLFVDDGTGEARFWYIDLASPLRRVRDGFEFVDHGIDIVVEPDLSSWRWKDADELAWYVEHGRYTAAEAAAIRAEGERAVTDVLSGRYDEWRTWHPDPAWTVPTFRTDAA